MGEIYEKAMALVLKLEEIGDSKEFLSVFSIAQVHHCPYKGETWTKELNELKALLQPKKGAAGE